MGFNAKDPLVQIGIVSVVFTVLAFLSTVYRLFIRRNRYWADDLFALFSLLAQFIMFAGALIHITHSSPRLSMIAAYYMMASAFYAVVWLARISIVFSIIRIHPDQGMRQKLYWVAALFALIVSVLISQLYWVCEPEGPKWKNEEAPQCRLTRQVVIFQIVTDVLSDIILVVVPIQLIRTLSDRKLRRRLMVIFSTCLITTAVSLVHAAFILVGAGPQEVIAAITEDCVSLIVCNAPVVATRLIQKWNKPESESRTAAGTTTTRLSMKFATWVTKSLSGTRVGGGGGGTFGSRSVGTGVAAVSTANETASAGWFRWERELGEDSESVEQGSSRQALSSDFELGLQARNLNRNRNLQDRTVPRTVTLDLGKAEREDLEQKKVQVCPDSDGVEDGPTTYPPRKQTVTWLEDVDAMDRSDEDPASRRGIGAGS